MMVYCSAGVPNSLGQGSIFLFSIDDLLLGQQPRSTAGSYPGMILMHTFALRRRTRYVLFGKVELGQGIIASLAQMLAEELEVPLQLGFHVVLGDTKLSPGMEGTNGSRSIKYFGPALRAAGAEAREVLIQMAAEYLKLPPERLIAKDGTVSDKSDPKNKVLIDSCSRKDH